MSAKVILGGCLIIGLSVVLAALILRPSSPAADRRESLIASFTQQVRAKIPSMHVMGAEEITKAEVESITLSNDRTILTIVPRIEWGKARWVINARCELKDDGFGGFTGPYSPFAFSGNHSTITLTVR